MIKPATSRTPRKETSFATVTAMSRVEKEPVVAKPERSAIMMIARMSSTMRMPKMSSANFSFFSPSSLRALMMMVVEEMERMAPRKTLSIVLQPKAWPERVAGQRHHEDGESGGDESGRADVVQFAQAELQTEREHEEDDPELREGVDGLLVIDPRQPRRVRTDDDTGEDVTEDDRLLETMEKNGDETGRDHDHREVMQETQVVRGGGSGSGRHTVETLTGLAASSRQRFPD